MKRILAVVISIIICVTILKSIDYLYEKLKHKELQQENTELSGVRN